MKRNPRKLPWTLFFRRLHKKGTVEEEKKKKMKRAAVSVLKRGFSGATAEDIKAKRDEKPQTRQANRDNAVRFDYSVLSVTMQSCQGGQEVEGLGEEGGFEEGGGCPEACSLQGCSRQDVGKGAAQGQGSLKSVCVSLTEVDVVNLNMNGLLSWLYISKLGIANLLAILGFWDGTLVSPLVWIHFAVPFSFLELIQINFRSNATPLSAPVALHPLLVAVN